MKILSLFVATIFYLTGNCQNTSSYAKKMITIETKDWNQIKLTNHLVDNRGGEKITGDFDGDSKKETLYLVPPVEDTLSTDLANRCFGGCDCYIIFSDSSLPILKVEYNLGGEVKNVGDLDGDGGDDILVYPYWWQSNWNPYCIYSFNTKTKTWNYLIDPVSIYLSELNFTEVLVKKSSKKGFVTAYTSEVNTDGNQKSSYKNFPVIKQ